MWSLVSSVSCTYMLSVQSSEENCSCLHLISEPHFRPFLPAPNHKEKQHPCCAFFSQLKSCSSTSPQDSSSATKCFISQPSKISWDANVRTASLFWGAASQFSACGDTNLFLSAKGYTLKPLLTAQVKLQRGGGWGWGRGWSPSQCMDQRQQRIYPVIVWKHWNFCQILCGFQKKWLYAFFTVSRFQNFKEASEIMRSGWHWLLWFSQLSNSPCLSK